ncbi:MAG: lysophospholipid acyltransferase family protein [Candidatus Omnitrophica bacterium]|nr:lysophospholipid acyltransferase family protein [Candidatus Omnitrophota bacterium]
MQKVIHFLEYVVIRLIGGLINLLPFSLALRIARPVGLLVFLLAKRMRRIALENLCQAFKTEKSESEIRQIARESFVYLAEFGAEWLRMPKIAKNPNRYLGIEDVDRIHDALKDGNGAILLVSHGGNWEIMALIGGFLIAKPINGIIYALARPLKNPYFYNRVIELRSLLGLKSITKVGAVRETFKRLKQNAIVSLLIDQRVGEGSVECQFFGRPALTTSLPALAALRLGTPIFYVSLPRGAGHRYVMKVEGPIPIEKTGDLKTDIQINTQRFNDRIESNIRTNPGRWLWMHNRWRVQHGAKD